MSLFGDFLYNRDKRLQLHEELDQHNLQLHTQQEEIKREHHAIFTKRFQHKIDEVIVPSFDQCVRSLHQYGIRAERVNRMDRQHPNVSLDIVYNRQNSCKLVLSPMETEEKVGMRVLICKHNVWNYEDATRVEVEQVTESLIREKVQEVINVLDEE